MQSMSVGLAAVSTSDPLFQQYATYYGNPTYADSFVLGALATTMNTTPQARAQFAQLVFIVTSLWMYTVHELTTSLSTCQQNIPFTQGDHGSAPLEEAWAFYTGSLEGPRRDYTHNGYLLFALADSLCAVLSTCLPSLKMSIINSKNLAVFSEAQSCGLDGLCSMLSDSISEIKQQLRTVLVQGLVQHMWEADTSSSFAGRYLAYVHVLLQSYHNKV